MGQIDVKNYRTENGAYSPGFLLNNLTEGTIYSFSCWVQIKGRRDSALIKARLNTATGTTCIGTTLARSHCWSFLKGGFVLDSPSQSSLIYFKNSDQNDTVILVKSASLQPFSLEQWNQHRDDSIQKRRKRFITVHVSNAQGNRVTGANVTAQQLSKDFPLGSAISSTIIGNQPYQEWFAERFNAAVFENELKWYATEPQQGKLNYTLADEMLEFVQGHQIMVRGHNIFWEDPMYTPSWIRNLTGDALRAAVNSRITSLLRRYKGDFVHWDVSNEMLHFNFYEEKLGPNATLDFFQTAKQADPLTTLFMNDFNVVETCEDDDASVDNYVVRLKQLMQGGEGMLQGIGLEGHFGKPNIPLMRAVLDKLATLRLPIWLTEIDISRTFGLQNQAAYLEEVLREGFSHPSMHGIMLWTALEKSGLCYQMCLTDPNFRNLPAGDVVDKLLQEWQSRDINGITNVRGSYSFSAFLGEYEVSVSSGNATKTVTFSLDGSAETKHINIQLM
ncbi:Endo-1,4-beta-xylanase F1 [Carex littledalei]|uniref:Endo-1,4-beta-xylanase F1 n=1 Tax=Carex littledalei TaxID=544730 RepID=A0A833QG67_9POAL|nr:Endo-1,4-beta-xylanase F1 [Carex littledalei]